MRMKDLAHTNINQLSLLELKIIPCHIPANHQYVMKPKPMDRFVYILKGKGCFSLGDTRLRAGERDMIYLPGETAYRSFWPEASEYMVIDLLLQDLEGNLIRFGESPDILFCDSHGVYLGLLEELAAKSNTTGPFDWLERLSLSVKLLCQIARDTNRSELDAQKGMIKVGITYLQNNYAEDIPVEQLAQMCGLSVGSFRRIFSQCMGISPVKYRNKLRMEKAAELLKGGGCTVGEAAEAVGISDIKYFGKLFKTYTGTTPGEFKKDN